VTNNTFNGNNNIINNTTNNVTINFYGAEDITHILGDKRWMDRLAEHCYMALPYMIRDVHFDPKRPDNHTVRMPNCRDKFVEVMTIKGWQSRMKKEVIRDLIQRNSDTLEEHVDSDDCAISPWKHKQFKAMIKDCVEVPYNKEKSNTLENEITIVMKDGRRACAPSPTDVAAPPPVAPASAAPADDPDLRTRSRSAEEQQLRQKLQEQQKIIEDMTREKEEMTRIIEELAREKVELSSELDLTYTLGCEPTC
jgi:hypothetical protein